MWVIHTFTRFISGSSRDGNSIHTFAVCAIPKEHTQRDVCTAALVEILERYLSISAWVLEYGMTESWNLELARAAMPYYALRMRHLHVVIAPKIPYKFACRRRISENYLGITETRWRMDEEWLVIVEFIKSLNGGDSEMNDKPVCRRSFWGKLVIVCLWCVQMAKPSSRLELVTNFFNIHSRLCGGLHGLQPTWLPGPNCSIIRLFQRDVLPLPISTLQCANLPLPWPIASQSSNHVLPLFVFWQNHHNFMLDSWYLFFQLSRVLNNQTFRKW